MNNDDTLLVYFSTHLSKYTEEFFSLILKKYEIDNIRCDVFAWCCVCEYYQV